MACSTGPARQRGGLCDTPRGWFEGKRFGQYFYVAPYGRDDWSGTQAEPSNTGKEGPFATLARARDVVRQRIAAGLTEPVTVLIRGGIYLFDEPIVFGPEDSGTDACPITYAAYKGERPVFDGSAPITAPWSRTNNGSIWSCQLAAGTAFTGLFVNGERQPRARMPNDGFFRARDIDGLHESHERFRFGKEDPLANWDDLASAVCVMRCYQWSETHVPIAAIDEAKRIVTLGRSTSYPIVPSEGAIWGNYRIENACAALDEPGEWCLNTETSTLYWWPPADLDPNEARIVHPNQNNLIAIIGDAEADRYVRHLILRGVTLRYTKRKGAALKLEACRNCEILENTIIDTLGTGIVLGRGACENRIACNELARFGSHGVSLSGNTRRRDEAGELQPANHGRNRITDNHIHHGGTAFARGCAITLSNTPDNHVAHNHVHDMPYIGISLTGRFIDDWEKARATKPVLTCEGDLIERNHIHDVLQDMRDGAAIYAFGMTGERGNIIRENVIHHVGDEGLAAGLYLDDECDNYLLRDNVVYFAAVGLLLHGCTNSTIENNVFAYSSTADMRIHPESYNVPPMNNVIRRNIWYMGRGELFHLANVNKPGDRFWGKEPFAEFNHNLYWRSGRPIDLGLNRGCDSESVIADPGFRDPAHGDFHLSVDSPARRIGFRSINLTGAGPRGQR